MAYQDTLFQLGMDLTRSSTAQKEDHSVEASRADSIAPGVGAASAQHDGHGTSHLMIDLYGAHVSDAKAVERAVTAALISLGKTVKSLRVEKLGNGRLSGVAVLPVGHWSIDVVPSTGLVAIDVRGCLGLDAHAAMFSLAEAFAAREAVIQKTRATDVAFLPAVAKAAKPVTKTVARPKQARAA